VPVWSVSFTGAVAEEYARHRRGFPPRVVDALVDALGLPRSASVLDLGCGTGQLTVPLAGRYARVLGADPSADMLRLARQAALAAGVRGIGWLLAADTDLDALPLLDGLDAVTISQAVHLLDTPRLFGTLATGLSDRGRVAVIANGTPLWLQDSAWSRALKAYLEGWLGVPLTSPCGTDPASRAHYRTELAAAGFRRAREIVLTGAEPLPFERIAGNMYSALDENQLPGDRAAFEADLRAALPAGPYVEDVRVSILVASR
jgi:SAM-dependent methyltransferase